MTSEEVTFTLEDLYKDLISTSKFNETVRRVSENIKENYEIIIELTMMVVGLPVEKVEEIFSEEYLEEKMFKNLNKKFDGDDFKPNNLQIQNIMKRLWKGVWKTICGIIKQGTIEERKEYGQAIKLVHEMLGSLSSSEIRNVRFAVICIAQILYENYLQTESDLEQQKEIVSKETKRGKKTARQAEKERIEKAQNHIEKLLVHISIPPCKIINFMLRYLILSFLNFHVNYL